MKETLIKKVVHASVCGVKSVELMPLTVIFIIIKIKLYDWRLFSKIKPQHHSFEMSF